MPATNAKTESGGFSAQERAAMKNRAAELRAEGNKEAYSRCPVEVQPDNG